MIKPILSRLYWWAHNYTEQRRMRKRLALLEQRLAAHDDDILLMARFPKAIQDRMVAYRIRLMEQIEAARRFV